LLRTGDNLGIPGESTTGDGVMSNLKFVLKFYLKDLLFGHFMAEMQGYFK
jgi:hypothetical protein